jgi:hypothetical protein
MLHVAMFDEINEGIAIFKLAMNPSQELVGTNSFALVIDDCRTATSDMCFRRAGQATRVCRRLWSDRLQASKRVTTYVLSNQIFTERAYLNSEVERKPAMEIIGERACREYNGHYDEWAMQSRKPHSRIPPSRIGRT